LGLKKTIQMFRRTFHVGQVISSRQLNFSLNGKFKVLTNSFSTSKTTSWTKKGIEESSSSFTLKLHGTSILSLRKIQTPNFNISAPSPFLSSRSFSTKSEKKEEKKPKPMSEAKIQKMEKVRGYLQELGRKKPIRRSMARSQQLEERKKNPIPNDTVLLYRSSNELDKVDAIWGIRRPRETLPPGSITSPYNKPKVHKEKPKKGKRQQAINQMDEESTEEQKPEPPPRISHTEVKAMLDSKQPVILIDLREPLLVENESSINGAYSFPISRRGSKPIKERALFLHVC